MAVSGFHVESRSIQSKFSLLYCEVLWRETHGSRSSRCPEPLGLASRCVREVSGKWSYVSCADICIPALAFIKSPQTASESPEASNSWPTKDEGDKHWIFGNFRQNKWDATAKRNLKCALQCGPWESSCAEQGLSHQWETREPQVRPSGRKSDHRGACCGRRYWNQDLTLSLASSWLYHSTLPGCFLDCRRPTSAGAITVKLPEALSQNTSPHLAELMSQVFWGSDWKARPCLHLMEETAQLAGTRQTRGRVALTDFEGGVIKTLGISFQPVRAHGSQRESTQEAEGLKVTPCPTGRKHKTHLIK